MRRDSLLAWPLVATLTACSQPAEPPACDERAAAAESAPTGAGWTGLTEPFEVIEARRVLMIETERLMKPIDGFIVGEPADAASLREDATAIGAMLLALPHLFPPTTNLYDPGVLDSPTIALPAIWLSFESFLAQAEAAESAAAALIAAGDDTSLRAAATRLRAACDACHAAFTKPYTPPVATDEDRNFDFESVLPPQ